MNSEMCLVGWGGGGGGGGRGEEAETMGRPGARSKFFGGVRVEGLRMCHTPYHPS